MQTKKRTKNQHSRWRTLFFGETFSYLTALHRQNISCKESLSSFEGASHFPDVSWKLSWGGVLCMSHWDEALGKPQDFPGGLCLWAGLISPAGLNEVSVRKEVWASLFGLLPPVTCDLTPNHQEKINVRKSLSGSPQSPTFTFFLPFKDLKTHSSIEPNL